MILQVPADAHKTWADVADHAIGAVVLLGLGLGAFKIFALLLNERGPEDDLDDDDDDDEPEAEVNEAPDDKAPGHENDPIELEGAPRSAPPLRIVRLPRDTTPPGPRIREPSNSSDKR
jgi:hypothetical protein